MKLTVCFGTQSDTEKIKAVMPVRYPETTLYPESYYATLMQISKNLISNNVDEMVVITTSPLILNATELIAANEEYELIWIDCSEDNKICTQPEELYRTFARVLQDYENMRYSDC